MKSSKGTRYFTARDFEWISTLLKLVRESGLNFAGIRYLLALLPCWNLNRCDDSKLGNCPNKMSASTPCGRLKPAATRNVIATNARSIGWLRIARI